MIGERRKKRHRSLVTEDRFWGGTCQVRFAPCVDVRELSAVFTSMESISVVGMWRDKNAYGLDAKSAAIPVSSLVRYQRFQPQAIL